jgi:nuclear transport factor 2 (NTF2) superfamily protein
MNQLPIPPFSKETALSKVQIAEDAWNSRDPLNVTRLISAECEWRSRKDSYHGRAAIEYFLKNKWAMETNYRLVKELWSFTDNRISIRFECEWQHAKTDQWYHSHGNEHWQFDSCGYMTFRDMSANNVEISNQQRKIIHQPKNIKQL